MMQILIEIKILPTNEFIRSRVYIIASNRVTLRGRKRRIVILLPLIVIIIIIFFLRRGKFGSGKGNLIPVSRSRKVCLHHHPRRGFLLFGYLSLSLSLSLPRRVLLTVTYRLTDLWPGRRPRAEGRSQTFCSPLLRGLIALTRSYYIIPTLLIFINLISRARVSFVYSSLSLIIIIIVVRKLYERRREGV